ncbi:MAG: HAD-IIIA family hydrolase [Firmicutes bacterium]|uniref:HAD-IIIA family hydrolase n=1 Tax=Candidatus Scatoplasma merdavium TaxID=2840932 RepID=A0A9D9DA84_9BACL|nr:HAD-IIIA family hydrolase [Candidatus Scatoplasma merdavium]
MKPVISTYMAKSLYQIDLEFFNPKVFKTIIFDLDNTLIPPKEKKPSKQSYELIEAILKKGINVFICSNRGKKRVKYFASYYKVNYLANTAKPFSYRLKRFISQNGIEKESCLYVGDKIINDMFMAKKVGLKSLYVEPLMRKQGIYSLLSPIEKKLQKKYARENRLGSYVARKEH